jgi:hypothetical protein
MTTFDQWWEQHGAKYSADACHMSEFHMASTVWAAAVTAERERCAKLCEEQVQNATDWDSSYWDQAAVRCAAAIRKGETP